MDRDEFKKMLAEGGMVITLVGMSNTGKTHWSRRMREVGFEHVHCDFLIERCLVSELGERSGIEAVSEWLGQPYEERFDRNQTKYLEAERKVMRRVVKGLDCLEGNTVIDTTGSVIYTGGDVKGSLKKRTLVVYIRADEAFRERALARYIERPKPVLWMDNFERKGRETKEEALRRCYPLMLAEREARYERWGEVTIDYEEVKRGDGPSHLLRLVEDGLS